MNKMPVKEETGLPTVPRISNTIQSVYPDVVRPFFPPRREFMDPLLDEFVAAQDPLMENNTVFTAGLRLREAGVQCESTIRELRRRPEATRDSAPEPEPERLSADEVRKARLRGRLQSVNRFLGPMFPPRC